VNLRYVNSSRRFRHIVPANLFGEPAAAHDDERLDRRADHANADVFIRQTETTYG